MHLPSAIDRDTRSNERNSYSPGNSQTRSPIGEIVTHIANVLDGNVARDPAIDAGLGAEFAS